LFELVAFFGRQQLLRQHAHLPLRERRKAGAC
jgi:hypothetical protein